MFLRSSEIPSNTEIDAAICIVGSGPAGIALGLELEHFNGRVVVLESGGLDPTREAQDLANAASTGLPFLPPDISRCRFFGGSSARWAGFCRPLDEDDFQARAWIPESGWPFPKSELAPYYARAQAIAQVEDAEWNPSDWFQDVRAASVLPPVGDTFFAANIYRSPNRYFGTSYREHFRRARGPEILLDATVTEIETCERAQRVERLRVQGLGGNSFTVRAKWFVLATGGIENARLLLLANRVQPAGLGNGADQVGRHLMNHPQIASAWVALKSTQTTMNGASQRHVPAAQRVTATSATMEREGIAKFSAYALPAQDLFIHPWAKGEAFDALTTLLGKNQRSALVPDRAALIGTILSGLPGLFADLGQRVTSRFQGSKVLCLLAECEQVPNPASRVRLSNERDRFGLPRATIDWRLTALDKRTIRRGVESLAESFQANQVGETVYDSWVAGPDIDSFPGQDWAHHAGTTRMNDDPRRGVVDRNARVHGVENLFVMGCSVFPTEGMTPPTLTILALACRLASHLRAQAQGGVAHPGSATPALEQA